MKILFKNEWMTKAIIVLFAFSMVSCTTNELIVEDVINKDTTTNSKASTRTINWSNRTWVVKNGSGGPGPNNWSDDPSAVWVDSQGRLHLKVIKRNGVWYSSEVYLQNSLGHGEYRFYTETNFDTLDPKLVTGLFTYENDSREIDIEFTGSFATPSSKRGWHTVQLGNSQSFYTSMIGTHSTHKILWKSDLIYWISYHGHYASLPNRDAMMHERNYSGPLIPPVGNEKLHINFWLFKGEAPNDGQEAELIIKDFTFIPEQ